MADSPRDARVEILSDKELGRTLSRLASQVLETVSDSRSLLLLGIPTRGVDLSRVLAQELEKRTNFSLAFRDPQWKNYGPLKVDWSNWQLMNNSYVTPTINENGKALYLAVNCIGRKLNATGINGNWRDWITPTDSFEHKLINDLCKTKERLNLL